ncbi:MAG: PIN domain-containing protein [Planctomycetaceae bacterium]|nr:PIN domain-containing protein [Planctomycetaceae bacterium]
MTYLLDVNVLVALFDSAHVHHEAAHRWFASSAMASWATCPITENGFIRVVSNPAYPTAIATPEEANARLRSFCAGPGHVFWPDELSLMDRGRFDLSRLQGHQQITDVYLAGLAERNGGKLATFDASIPTAAIVGARADLVEVIPQP